MNPFRPVARILACAALALGLFGAVPSACAQVLKTDRVGGTAVSVDPARLGSVAPDVEMKAGFLMAAVDGRELWSRAPDQERAMASTTKIMTAVVVVEAGGLDRVVSVPENASRIGESEAGLKTGERLSIRKLLEAMMVKSGNDAAIALAQRVGGTVDEFVRMMDLKASELDLSHSDFANPHGLDQPGHFTSARDLASLTRYAMREPEFRRAVGMRKAAIPTKSGTKVLENSNTLLKSYPGANGVKTGWTDDAGYCLVGSARRGGIELVAVVLGTGSEKARFKQATTLLDWGFAHYKVRTIAEKGASEGAVPVSDYLDVTVPAVVAETTSAALLDTDGELSSELDIMDGVRAPLRAGDRLGTLTVKQGDRLLAQLPVVARDDVERPGTWQRLRIGVVRAWRKVFGGQLVAQPVAAGAVP